MKNTKNLRKILFLAILILSIENLSYSYEDYYNKVYIVKISKKDIFKAVNANQKQQKKLSEIFDNYQRKAEKIEKERYMKVAEVLSFEQLTAFNKYINGKKLEFEEKNDKIKNLLDNLNLTNEQKSEILKQDRDFKREVNKLKDERLSESDFVSRYDSLKNVRNEKIREVLNEEQRKVVDSY